MVFIIELFFVSVLILGIFMGAGLVILAYFGLAPRPAWMDTAEEYENLENLPYDVNEKFEEGIYQEIELPKVPEIITFPLDQFKLFKNYEVNPLETISSIVANLFVTKQDFYHA